MKASANTVYRPRSKFLSIPLELREQIYRLAILPLLEPNPWGHEDDFSNFQVDGLESFKALYALVGTCHQACIELLPLLRSRQDQTQKYLSRLPDFNQHNTRVYLGGERDDVDVHRDLLSEVKKGVKRGPPLYTFKVPDVDPFLLFHCLGCEHIRKSDFQKFCGYDWHNAHVKSVDMVRAARASYKNLLRWLTKHFEDLVVLEAIIVGGDVEQARRMGQMAVGYKSFCHTYGMGPFYLEYRAASEERIVGEWRLAAPIKRDCWSSLLISQKCHLVLD